MQDLSNSILAAVKAFVETCPFLSEIDLHIDQVDSEPVNYSIQTSGLVKLSEDVCGNQNWRYNAILQSREYTSDDLSRLNASEFTENFIFWTEEQNKNHVFPDLAYGLEPTSISADNGILMAIDDDGDRGVYQIQIHLNFDRNLEEL